MDSQTGVINKFFIAVGTFIGFRILQWLTGQWLIGQMFLSPQMADHSTWFGYLNPTAYCWYKFLFDRLIGHWCWGNWLIDGRIRTTSAVTSQVLAHVELLAALACQTSNCFLSTLFAGVLTNIYIQRKLLNVPSASDIASVGQRMLE